MSDDDYEIPEDYDGDPDDYEPPPRVREVPVVYPFSQDCALFRVVSDRVLVHILDFLPSSTIYGMCVLSRLWNNVLEEDSFDTFWSGRFMRDLGQDAYKESLMLRPNMCGWTVKQHLQWHSVALRYAAQNKDKRFHKQREVWCGIMKQRKRKFYDLHKESKEEAPSLSALAPPQLSPAKSLR